MDLAELKFKVDTSELRLAKDLLDTLAQAASKVGDSTSGLAKANKDEAAAQLLAAKARRENAAALREEAKAADAAAKAASTKAKAESETVAATDRSVKVRQANVNILEREKNILSFQSQGFSKGMSTILAIAKATGQWSKELEQVLLMQRQLQGSQPFDKSLGAVERLKNEYAELKFVMSNYNNEAKLSSNQLRELFRAEKGLKVALQEKNASAQESARAIRQLRQEYTKTAIELNKLEAVEREMNRAAKEQSDAMINAAKATSFLERELARAENALEGLNNEVNISTSNRLKKFRDQLAMTNKPLEEQNRLYKQYQKTLEETDRKRKAINGKQAAADDQRRVDLLARSLSPQISDVVVSLAGGMNPFTVLMQQGLQVRDLMQLSGVQAEKMGEAFKKAGQGMISTSVAAARAIGSMLGGAITDAGKSITGFVAKLTGFDKVGAYLTKVAEKSKDIPATMDAGTAAGTRFLGVIARIGLSLGGMIATIAGATLASFILALGVAGVALAKVIGQENELNRAVTMNVASLGANYDQAYTVAKAYGDMTGKGSDAVAVMGEMAKAGNLNVRSYNQIADAAIAMNKAVGTSVEDTVKTFSELAKKPTEVLTELAITSGRVDLATIQLVSSLEASGNKADAAAVAIKAYSEATKEAASEVTDNYGTLTRFAIGAKEIFSDMWDAILGIGRKGTLADQISAAQAEVTRTARLVDSTGSDGGFSQQEYSKAVDHLATLQKQLKTQKEQTKTRQDNAILAKTELLIEADRQKAMTEYQRKTNVYIQKEAELRQVIATSSDPAIIAGAERQLNSIREIRNNLEKDYLKDLEKQNKVKKSPKSEAQKAKESLAKKELAIIEKINDATAKATTKAKEYTAVEQTALDIFDDPAWKGYYDETLHMWVQFSESTRKAIAQTIELKLAEEDRYLTAIKFQEALIQKQKEAFENDAKALDQLADYELELRDAIEQLELENSDIVYQGKLLGMNDRQRKKAIETRKIEIEYAKELKRIEQLRNANPGLDTSSAEAMAAQKREAQLRNLNAEIANEARDEWSSALADAITTGLTEGGEEGAQKFRDQLEAVLKKPIAVFVNAVVNTVAKGFASGSSLSDIWGGIKNAYSAYSQDYTQYIEMAGGAIEAYGNYVGSSNTASFGTGMRLGENATPAIEAYRASASYNTTMANTYSSMGDYEMAAQYSNEASTMSSTANSMSYGQTASNVGQGLIGAYLGNQLGMGISDGYGFGGDQGATAVNVGVAIGSLWGPIGAVVGGAIGGVVNLAFGRKLTELGTKASIVGGQIQSVENYKFEKGGWFRSDKTTSYGSADPATIKQITEDFKALQLQAMGLAAGLGLSTDSIANYSGTLKLNMKDVKTAEDANKAYSEALEKLYVDMLKHTPGFDQYIRKGETVQVALQRLTDQATQLAQAAGYSQENITATLVAGMTGQMNAEEVGAALGDQIIGGIYNAVAMGFANQISSAITGLIIQPIMTSVIAGGAVSTVVSQAAINAVVAQAQAAINAFNQIISDPAFQGMISQITGMIGTISGTVVKPAANIRRFGSAALAAGNAAKEAAKKIADERYQLEDKLLNALNRVAKLRTRELNALDKSNQSLQRLLYTLEDAQTAYDNVVNGAEEAISTASEQRDAIKSIFDTLQEGIDSLRTTADTSSVNAMRAAYTLIQGAIDSQVLPDQAELQDAITAITDGIQADNFATKADYDRASLQAASMLEELQNIAGSQYDTVDQNIKLLEDQLESSKQQINILLGIEESSYNVETALIALLSATDAYGAAIKLGLKQSLSAANTESGTKATTTYTASASQYESATTTSGWTAQGYWDKNSDLQEYWNAYGSILTSTRGWSRDDFLNYHWNAYGLAENRQFAKGGAFTNSVVKRPTFFDMGQMGEAGSEAILPLANVGGSLGVKATTGDDGETVSQLETLNLTVMQMAVAINKLQRQFATAKGEDGISLNVTVTGDTSASSQAW